MEVNSHLDNPAVLHSQTIKYKDIEFKTIKLNV